MTDLFSFILVMVSLVLAIGVTHLVQGVADLVRHRGRVRLDPVPLVWAAALFVVAALYWWSLWDLRAAEWRFPLFFYMLLAPTLLHVAASLLVSTEALEAGASVQAAFDRIRVPFMLVMAAFSVVVTWDGWIVGTEPAWTAYRPVQIWTIGLYLAGAAFGSVRAQRVIAGLVLVTYVVAGFFFRFLPGAFAS
ncbi:MAG: hypothetical protein R3181_09470 [Rubricoccaceae bacterium]|nr:hypothetical protein [Rubricoccaceae bacterium]